MNAIVNAGDDLKSLGKFKEIMTSILFQSEDIVNMVMPVLDDSRFGTSDNFFGGCNLPTQNTETGTTEYVTLLGHCFDFPYIKDTITDERTVITMDTSITRIQGEHLKEVEIDVFVLTHRNTVQLESLQKRKYAELGYCGNRIDMIVSAVHSAVMERARDFGIGKMTLSPENPIIPYMPNDNYYGKKMAFLCSDFYKKPKNQR